MAWKSWPVEHYQALGRRLVEHGLRVLVVKGPGEEEVARKVAEAIGPEAVVEVADGYPMHAALLARAEALVLNDGGNLHLAAGVDTPTVTVYGPTDPVIWGPVDTERHRRLVAPCDCSYALDCGPPPKCVASIEVDRVARELWDLLGLDETAA